MNLFIIKTWLQAFFSKNDEGERGASLVEYILLVALIAIAIIAGAVWLGTSANDKLDSVGSTVDGS